MHPGAEAVKRNAEFPRLVGEVVSDAGTREDDVGMLGVHTVDRRLNGTVIVAIGAAGEGDLRSRR